MTETTDRRTYEALKTMYNTAFYSKEVKDTFTITGETTGFKRTAWSYYEYLYYKNPMLYKQIFHVDFEEAYHAYLIEKKIDELELTYEEFITGMELGEIKVNFGELKQDVVDDLTVKDEKIYYYVNHLISRIQIIIKNIKYMYLLNDTVTPLEDLLIKLVRFFKSFTVDMIGLDTILVCDLKSENILRLFDEIHYMEKTIQPEERMNISYSDTIDRIISIMEEKDTMTLKDKLFFETFLYIDNLYDWATNEIKMKDKLWYVSANTQFDESMSLYDNCRINSNLYIDEKSNMFKDRIVKIWYDNED